MFKRAIVKCAARNGDAVVCNCCRGQQPIPLDRITLPPGFEIEIYAEGLSNPRSMVLAPNGTLFVGSRIEPRAIAAGVPPNAGQVYAVLDRDRDQQADEVITIDIGLNAPNGVAFRDGALYVAEINRVLRYDDIESSLDAPPKPVVVNDSFPTTDSGGSSSTSDRRQSCTCRLAHHAISAITRQTTRDTPRSCG